MKKIIFTFAMSVCFSTFGAPQAFPGGSGRPHPPGLDLKFTAHLYTNLSHNQVLDCAKEIRKVLGPGQHNMTLLSSHVVYFTGKPGAAAVVRNVGCVKQVRTKR